MEHDGNRTQLLNAWRDIKSHCERRRRWRIGATALAAIAAIAGCVQVGQTAAATTTQRSRVVAAPTEMMKTKTSTPAVTKSVQKAYRFRPVVVGGGGWVTGISVNAKSGLSYARTDVGGAYRFDQATSRWTQMIAAPGLANPQDSDYEVESLASAPSNPKFVYIAVGADDLENPVRGRVLSSQDGGKTWKASTKRWFMSGNGESRQIAERLSVDPADPKRVLLGTRSEGVWLSEDAGVQWRQVGGLPTANLGEGSDRPGVSFVLMIPGGSGSNFQSVVGISGAGVFRTNDGAKSWTQIETPQVEQVVPLDGQVVGNTLWVSLASFNQEAAGKVVSIDLSTNAVSDHTPPPGTHRWALAVHPKVAGIVLASDTLRAFNSLWLSRDNGATWNQLKDSFPGAPSWLAPTLDGCVCLGNMRWDPLAADQLWFANGSGVWKGALQGDKMTFDFVSKGIEETVATGGLVAPDGAFVSTVADFQGFRHASVLQTPPRMLTNDKFANGSHIEYSGQNPNSMVWVGAEYHIYWQDNRIARGSRSDDGGKTWQALPNLDKDLFGGNVAVSATDPNNIVWLPSYFINPWEFNDHPKGISVTTNGGGNWTKVTPLGSSSFHRLHWWTSRQALAADRVTGGTFYLMDQNATLAISTDGGLNWSKAANAPNCVEANACHVFGQLHAAPNAAGRLYASIGQDGLWRSVDAGATPWKRLGTISDVHSFTFGAPRKAGEPPTIFAYARLNAKSAMAVLRSDDDGATWVTVSQYPLGIAASVTALAADPNKWGKVFIGFSGLGFVEGLPVP